MSLKNKNFEASLIAHCYINGQLYSVRCIGFIANFAAFKLMLVNKVGIIKLILLTTVTTDVGFTFFICLHARAFIVF